MIRRVRHTGGAAAGPQRLRRRLRRRRTRPVRPAQPRCADRATGSCRAFAGGGAGGPRPPCRRGCATAGSGRPARGCSRRHFGAEVGRLPAASSRASGASEGPALHCGGAARVRSRAIPAAVRRHVWKRDRGCCSDVDGGSGRRCGSRHLLEIDHVVPYALGGSAEPDNLRLLSAAHHRHRHARRGNTSRAAALQCVGRRVVTHLRGQ